MLRPTRHLSRPRNDTEGVRSIKAPPILTRSPTPGTAAVPSTPAAGPIPAPPASPFRGREAEPGFAAGTG
jgi:hypothetical protein